MNRRLFEQSLVDVQESVLELASLAEKAVIRSVRLLKERDFEAAQELIRQDRCIDEKRYAIEAEVLTLIATQSPLARDMRSLAASLFISNELERIADYGKGIARVNLRIGDEPLIKPLIDIPRMAEAGQEMLREAMQAYVTNDADRARRVIPHDDVVDGLYDQIYAELMTRIIENPGSMRQANLLLMAAHNLERTADRVTNICERVIYAATGQFLETGWHENGPLAPA